MSGSAERHPIALKKVVYEIPGMASAVVRRDVPYGTTGAAGTMDLYYPSAAAAGAMWPVTVVVLGYPPREPNPLGCAFKETGMEIKDVARERLTSWWPAKEQGELTVGDGVLG